MKARNAAPDLSTTAAKSLPVHAAKPLRGVPMSRSATSKLGQISPYMGTAVASSQGTQHSTESSAREDQRSPGRRLNANGELLPIARFSVRGGLACGLPRGLLGGVRSGLPRQHVLLYF